MVLLTAAAFVAAWTADVGVGPAQADLSAGCESDNDCKGSRICKGGACSDPPKSASCSKDTDCKGDRICEDGACTSSARSLCAFENAADLSDLSSSSNLKADEAQGWIKRIMKKVFLSNSFDVYARPGINNAVAAVQGGRRIIAYDPSFLDRLNGTANTKWAAIFVLAHEVGHHVEGHTVASGCSRRAELQADAFATRVLHAFGANLQQTKAGMTALGGSGGACHPPSSERTKHIAKVYKEANEGVPDEKPSEPDPDVKLPDTPNPQPPKKTQGFPAGTVTIPCGCHGFVTLGARRANPACHSGWDQALACQHLCPAGGVMWGARCM
jgi:hypothetical protein